jgi:hypothetical protein
MRRWSLLHNSAGRTVAAAAGKRRWRPLHNSAGRTVAAALQEKEGGCPLEYRKTPLLALHAVVAWSLVFSLVWLLTIGCVFL